MRIPNLPANVSLGNLVTDHALIRELANGSPEAKRLANTIFRMASSTNTAGGRIGTIGRGFSAILLNALSPADGFNPWMLKMDELTAGLLNPKTHKAKYRELALIGLSHPDAGQSATVYEILKAQNLIKGDDLQALVDMAHAAKGQRRTLGVSDTAFMDSIAEQSEKRLDTVTAIPDAKAAIQEAKEQGQSKAVPAKTPSNVQRGKK